MSAFWSATVAELLSTDPETIIASLAHAQLIRFRVNEATQLRAWDQTLSLLRDALGPVAAARGWRVLLEMPLLRLGRRADVVLVSDRAILVLEIKAGATSFSETDRMQAEDFALDLQDFHAGSRSHPIVPILVATDAPSPAPVLRLPLPGVAGGVLDANALTLPRLLSDLHDALSSQPSAPRLDGRAWEQAAYRPVPGIVEAARMLYARHGVGEIASARADVHSLGRTTRAVCDALAEARARGERRIVFVTGVPGAGKTLCGLNICLGEARLSGVTFLTGNPSLVHVLREALARDATGQGGDARAARQRMEGVIQALPRFRDHHVGSPGECPAERVVVVDEAQRCWSSAHAVRKSKDRPVRLSRSEPAHLLDIMARHEGWSAMVCLVGGGQEIHDGEGGLAEWGKALAERPDWTVLAAPQTLDSPDPVQRLPRLPGLQEVGALHLDVPVRQVRSAEAGSWVDAVLAGDEAEACRLSGPGAPFTLTRDLHAMRARLRAAARGSQRCGLLASSGARRLRAEGLGVELAHMDASAVARWFLDRWPDDVRASDALEVVATEFSAQGLELDFVGLAWDGDLVRGAGPAGWRSRSFRGTDWAIDRSEEVVRHRLNTYRVLLTRARYETVIWVPRGSPFDRTRPPGLFDALASFLVRCGAVVLDDRPQQADTPAHDRPNAGSQAMPLFMPGLAGC